MTKAGTPTKRTAKKVAPKKTNTNTPAIKPNISLDIAFPIHVIKIQWDNVEELNAALEFDLYKERARDPEGIYRSNTASTWHSQTDLFDGRIKTDAMKTLAKMFNTGFCQIAGQNGCPAGTQLSWKQQAWAMMYRNGGYATAHNHPNCHYAGVYYIAGVDDESPEKVMATGAKVKQGMLEFISPHAQALSSSAVNLHPAYRIKPKAGLMLI